MSPTPPDTSKPPYYPAPEFSGAEARETAFAGSVAGLTSWGYMGAQQWIRPGAEAFSAARAYDAGQFRDMVAEAALRVCAGLGSGVDANDVPRSAQVPVRDPVDQAAFMVEAVAFFCPDQIADVTRGTYTTPVLVPQDEDCPAGAGKVTITTRVVDQSEYAYTVTNPYPYDLHLGLDERLHGTRRDPYTNPYVPTWRSGPLVRVPAHGAYDGTGQLSGVYDWTKVDLRPTPGDFLFLQCGYEPGPAA